jgi:hypothetical protein
VLHAVQVTMKSVSNEGHFTLQSEGGHVTLPTHTLHVVQVRLKSVSNEGHFTLEAETVFRPYLPSH